MSLVIHSAWHSMSSHFAVGFAAGSSLLIVVGLVAELMNKRELSSKLSYPIHVMSFLSLLSILVTCAAAITDFPTGTFVASPWFRFKTTLAIVSFFVYTAIYYMFSVMGREIWKDRVALTYAVILAILGGFTVSLLGAAGGYMAQGHSVLEFLLRALGVPMSRA
ncbi:MAG: hypothetical protein QI197_05870 [Candidatus Korarchaeota archaeon]|nr:hypothetical protein [Candidatus Korarchaeota archaeon]